MTRTPSILHVLLWIAPVILVAGGFLASAVWIAETFGEIVSLVLAGAAAVFVMAYSVYLGARWHRGMDEVQQASANFSAQWGPSVGHIAFVLLLLLPPVQQFLAATANGIGGEDAPADETVITLAVMFGFMGCVLLQGVGRAIVGVVWWNSKR